MRFDVLRTTHISKRTKIYAGSVYAENHDEAARIACDENLILDFQCFSVEPSPTTRIGGCAFYTRALPGDPA